MWHSVAIFMPFCWGRQPTQLECFASPIPLPRFMYGVFSPFKLRKEFENSDLKLASPFQQIFSSNSFRLMIFFQPFEHHLFHVFTNDQNSLERDRMNHKINSIKTFRNSFSIVLNDSRKFVIFVAGEQNISIRFHFKYFHLPAQSIPITFILLYPSFLSLSKPFVATPNVFLGYSIVFHQLLKLIEITSVQLNKIEDVYVLFHNIRKETVISMDGPLRLRKTNSWAISYRKRK